MAAAAAAAPSPWDSCSVNDGSGAVRVVEGCVEPGLDVVVVLAGVELVCVLAGCVAVVDAGLDGALATVTVLVCEPHPASRPSASRPAGRNRLIAPMVFAAVPAPPGGDVLGAAAGRGTITRQMSAQRPSQSGRVSQREGTRR